MLDDKPVVLAGRSVCAQSTLFVAALLLLVVATRWPLASNYLYYFDSANFALALDDYNPALHQPQPPGYPLFVALTRLIHLWVQPPQEVFLIAGLLAACAAVLLIRILAADLFGRAAGFLSAALLASDPVFWFAGITNQVRLFLALAAIGVALTVWRAISRPESPAWLYAAFAVLGIAAGFRPVVAVLLLPMPVWAWFRTGRSISRLAIGVGLLLATVAPWAAFTVWVVGGPLRFAAILWDYANVQFEPTSAVFGAAPHSAWIMFTWAVVWNLVGAIAWVFALPYALRRPFGPGWTDKAILLALGFFPQFLFSALVHIGDPDQALASVAILSVIGGGALSAFSRRSQDRHLLAICTAVIAIHAVVFFYPPGKIARAASYRAFKAVDRMNTGALTAIETLRRSGPVTIVHYGSSVATRHLYYYFPDEYVVVLPGRPGESEQADDVQVFYRRRSLPHPDGAAGWLRPGTRKVICLLPWNANPGIFRARGDTAPFIISTGLPEPASKSGRTGSPAAPGNSATPHRVFIPCGA
jgi:hypothetical protein